MKRAGNSWKVVLLAVVLLAAMQSSAFGAGRYCGTGVKRTATTVTTYVGLAWDRPGYRQMSTRKHWSATLSYYPCKPVTR